MARSGQMSEPTARSFWLFVILFLIIGGSVILSRVCEVAFK